MCALVCPSFVNCIMCARVFCSEQRIAPLNPPKDYEIQSCPVIQFVFFFLSAFDVLVWVSNMGLSACVLY